METHTKAIGNLGELAAMFALNRKGIPISLPYGDNQRYDLIIDHNNKLSKVQIKTCLKDKDGMCTFPLQSKLNHTTNKNKTTYINEVDYFILYCISLDKLAIVPIEQVKDKKNFNLRVTPPKNNQGNVNYFDDYSLDKILI